VAPSICSGGACGGLKGEYYQGRTFEIPRLVRTDPNVNFDFGTAAPDPALPIDGFSIRWTGKVVPRHSEIYTFHTWSDDGVRLWVNGVLLINNWTDHAAAKDSGILNVALVAGQAYDVRMEMYDGAWLSTAKLLWSSASQPEEIIPTSQLVPAP
jgi:hypothetical protein